MKVRISRLSTIIAGVLFATIMPAQELSPLPQDPAVRYSVLPNGLSCYVASNGSSKGMADFALIKRDYAGNETVLYMEGVMVSSETVQDSTLLALMKRVDHDRMPADHAVIVCGDVDASSVMNRLRYMSLMIDASTPSPVPECGWEGDGKLRVSSVQDTLKGLATVRCEWEAPVTPVEYMNTVQAAVYEKAVWEMGEVICRWVNRNLRSMDIPVADITCRHSGRKDGLDHEEYVIETTVALPDVESAKREVVSVLAALDAGRVGLTDLLLAEKEYYYKLEKAAGRVVRNNDDYVQLCVRAFLYNSPLACEKECLAFFKSKDVPENTRKRIFTDIVSALISVDTHQDTLAEVPAGILLSDTLALPGAGLKMKVKSSRKDAFSGGVVWTFENGFKVIYKKMPTSRTLHYSLSLNSGYANVEDLERGEGAYMSDYLDCCWIAGMKGAYFKDLLKLSGMTMNTRVGLSGTVLSGQVSDRNAHLMMKGLLAVTGTARPDSAAVGYHARSERLRMNMVSDADLRTVMDSLMCPGYRFTPYKTGEGVRGNTFAKAEKLFAQMTSRMNDGVLVIAGDMPETDLKKLLQVYVGGFKVRSVASRRPSMQYHPVSGWSMYSVDGEKDAVVVAVSGLLPMTASNHFASEIAAMMLERRVKENFKDRGMSVRLSSARSIYPDERLSVYVTLGGVCGHEEAQEVRGLLSDLAKDIDAEVLKACKDYVKNAYSLQMQTPGYWLRVIPLRHLEGKDFTSGCAAKIDAVTADQVRNIFGVLHEGAGVEYVIRKKQ